MTAPPAYVDRAMIQAALAGDQAALHVLVAVLTPVVQARTLRVLVRRRAAHGDRLLSELEDYKQDALAELFAQDGRALLGWDPAGGRSLRNYVGQRVEWYVSSLLRSTPPATLPETEPEPLEPVQLELRDSVRRLISDIEARWSQYGLRLFYLLFVEEAQSKDVGAELGLTCNAVDRWRLRMREFARSVLLEE